MIDRHPERQRGFVLLVALGVLGVLGLLAATFATLSRVEKVVSNSYVDKVRAKLLAQSGIERAIASIRGRGMVQSWDDTRNDWYYREMLNSEVGTAIVYPAATKSDIWKFTPTRSYGMPPRSIERALEDGMGGAPNGVSFPQAKSASVNEAFSGEFPGTYQLRGDIYALKVLDCASMININDGGEQMVRVLNNLGAILKCSDGTLVSAGGFLLGTKIQTKAMARGRGFSNKAEVLDEVFIQDAIFSGNPAGAKMRFDAVKDFITCHGWMDGTTARFVSTWTGSYDYVGGSYASATAGSGGGSGSGGSSGSGSSSGSGGGIGTGGGSGSSSGKGDPIDSGGGKGDPIDSGGGKGDPYDSGGGIMPDDGVFTKADPGVPAFATSPLYSFSATVPGSYASLPATKFLAAPPVNPVKDTKYGGGFRQYVLAQGGSALYGGQNTAAKASFAGSPYKMEPRCPVNVNTASREVLVAVLNGLEADFWDYTVVSETPGAGLEKEYNSRLGNINVKIDAIAAAAAADWLISSRFTFGTPAGAWSFNDWMHFESEVVNSIPGLTRFQKGLIRANANPNTNLRKLCPDLIMVDANPAVNPEDYVRMDKSDVKIPSTEFTFSSNGFYEIESIGRIYNGTKIMAEEKIETVVKIWDQLRYSTQEQFEQDREWIADTGTAVKEGDLLSGGYPPVISMPEYAYNPLSSITHYRSQTGDITWAAEYEGYLVLNGPAKITAGQTPGPAKNPTGYSYGYGDETAGCWGFKPEIYKGVPILASPASQQKCGVSFVAGFNNASLYPNQSHRNAWHRGAGAPTHPEYSYYSPHCFADGGSMSASPANSSTADAGYVSAYYSPMMPHSISTSTGANVWDAGCDLTNFGVYINWLRRNRFHTYWADEVPSPDVTIEMTVKPEQDLWTWATNSKMHMSSSYYASYSIWPCKRQFLFDWGTGSTYGMNHTVRLYAELSRVYLEFYDHTTSQFYVMYGDHSWKPHTWHHVEVSWIGRQDVTLTGGGVVTVPPNAMLFIDGQAAGAAGAEDHILASKFGPGLRDVKMVTGVGVYAAQAMVLEKNVHCANPNNDVGTGPRFDVGSTLANDGSFGMSSPRWIGLIDNIVMHHWRAHSDSFTPRNRYHSTSYYDGTTMATAVGFSGETAGVYKKRLMALEAEALTKNITIGTVGCTHYHPWHVHLYGHDGAAATTSFGHITPSVRINTGGAIKDFWYYDGCVGVPVKKKVAAGDKVYYMGWFEVASSVPVTMSPLLCDINITYFAEPKTFYRLSASEAKK